MPGAGFKKDDFYGYDLDLIAIGGAAKTTPEAAEKHFNQPKYFFDPLVDGVAALRRNYHEAPVEFKPYYLIKIMKDTATWFQPDHVEGIKNSVELLIANKPEICTDIPQAIKPAVCYEALEALLGEKSQPDPDCMAIKFDLALNLMKNPCFLSGNDKEGSLKCWEYFIERSLVQPEGVVDVQDMIITMVSDPESWADGYSNTADITQLYQTKRKMAAAKFTADQN